MTKSIVVDRVYLGDSWRIDIDGDDMGFSEYVVDEWILKGTMASDISAVQPPEVGDEPAIFAPEMVALDFSDPSALQPVEGCSVADEDSLELILEVTTTNGAIDLPLDSGADYEEISGGIRLTGSIAQLNVELAGMGFLPTNLPGPEPQDGTIDLVLDDQDGSTGDATHTITVEVLDFGRD